MAKSHQLRLSDVRAAFRLVGECRDLGYDPQRWGRHLFEGIPRLIGARVAAGGESRRRPDGGVFAVAAFDVGLEPRERVLYLEFQRTDGLSRHPLFLGVARLSGRLVARTRRQVVADRDWYHSACYSEYHRPSRLDHCMACVYTLSAGGANSFVTLHRTAGEPDFPKRQQRLMRLFHAEVGRLIGSVLVSAIDPCGPTRLPPRVRETLQCLLEGDGEKQAAARMGLSVATVHQYVTALYRHYRVASRAELLARVFRRSSSPVT